MDTLLVSEWAKLNFRCVVFAMLYALWNRISNNTYEEIAIIAEEELSICIIQLYVRLFYSFCW